MVRVLMCCSASALAASAALRCCCRSLRCRTFALLLPPCPTAVTTLTLAAIAVGSASLSVVVSACSHCCAALPLFPDVDAPEGSVAAVFLDGPPLPALSLTGALPFFTLPCVHAPTHLIPLYEHADTQRTDTPHPREHAWKGAAHTFFFLAASSSSSSAINNAAMRSASSAADARSRDDEMDGGARLRRSRRLRVASSRCSPSNACTGPPGVQRWKAVRRFTSTASTSAPSSNSARTVST